MSAEHQLVGKRIDGSANLVGGRDEPLKRRETAESSGQESADRVAVHGELAKLVELSKGRCEN